MHKCIQQEFRTLREGVVQEDYKRMIWIIWVRCGKGGDRVSEGVGVSVGKINEEGGLGDVVQPLYHVYLSSSPLLRPQSPRVRQRVRRH